MSKHRKPIRTHQSFNNKIDCYDLEFQLGNEISRKLKLKILYVVLKTFKTITPIY